MTIFKNNWPMIIVTTLFWCILNESFNLSTVSVGFIVSIVTIIAIRLLFSDDNFKKKNKQLSLLSALRYVVVLFINIFKSTKVVMDVIMHGDDLPMIVTVKTKVHDLWPRCLVANGVTLTPGTVTIDIQDDEFTVLWLNPTTNDPDLAAEIILGHFEKVFIKKEDKHA